MHSTRYARQRPRWVQASHTISFVFGSTKLGKAAVITMATADSNLKTSRAVPHPSTMRARARLPSEVARDPVSSSRYGRSGMSVSDQAAYRSDHGIAFVFGVKTLGEAATHNLSSSSSLASSSSSSPSSGHIIHHPPSSSSFVNNHPELQCQSENRLVSCGVSNPRGVASRVS